MRRCAHVQSTPTKPLVSAIIPTRNRSHCLPRAIESILSQEGLGAEFELETIVVDDASTDLTEQVVNRHGGLRYVRLAAHRGVSAALNAGIEASAGQFITVLDDDDEWLPHKLHAQVPLLAAHGDIGVVYGQALVRYEGQERLFPEAGRAPSGWVFFDMLLDNFCGIRAATLVRRESLDAVGRFDESLTSCEDFDMSLRLARRFPFHFPGAVTVYNQSRHGQYLSEVITGAAARCSARAIEKALGTLPATPEYAATKDAARARVALDAAATLFRVGELERARDDVRTTLKRYPQALAYPWAWWYVNRVGLEL
jgi:glycosyltransferase involved in cell wall biosynthesis